MNIVQDLLMSTRSDRHVTVHNPRSKLNALDRPAPARPFQWDFDSRYAAVAMMGIWLFIGVVAAYDVYLSVKYHESLPLLERNPLGRLLLEMDCGNVALFMGCKCIGTLIVLGILQIMFMHRPKWGLTVGTALASFQASLAWYLTFG